MKQLTVTTCPACGSKNLEAMPGGESVHLRAFDQDVQTALAACLDCGHLFQSQPLDQPSLMAYYAASAQRRTRDLEPIDHEVFQQQIRFVAAGLDTPPDRVLEIGADTGTFLDAVAPTWPTCQTFFDEANEEACRILADTPHQDIRSIPEANRKGHFDVVVLRHILEHIPEPAAWLKWLTQGLSPRGVLFIEVPDWSLLDADTGFVSFEHVSYYTQASMSRLLQQVGMVPVRQELALNRTYPNARHRVLRVLAAPLQASAREDWTEALKQHILWGKDAKYHHLNERFSEQDPASRPALYGASWLADQIIRKTCLNAKRVVGIFDIDPKKHGTEMHGIPVYAPEQISEIQPDAMIIASSSEEPIKRRLNELGYTGTIVTWSEL